jgi:hypothetical protein
VDAALNRQTQSAVVKTHADTVETAASYGFEMQRRMGGIDPKLRKALVGERLYGRRMRAQALPEPL